MSIAINSFAEGRHTPSNPYSHYNGPLSAVCKMAEEGERTNIAPDGSVFKVTTEEPGFYTGMTQLKPGAVLVGTFAPRENAKVEEYPYISFKAQGGSKVKAEETDLICYTHAALAADGDNTTNEEAEIVSINAKRKKGAEPMHPVTALRNAREYPGGTKAVYTAEELLDMIEYHIGGGPKAPYVMLDSNGKGG